MEFVDKILTKDEIVNLQKVYGDYVKLTIDLEKEWLVAGSALHADGEKVLLERGGGQDNIWGGGINFESKQIDATAVLNLRPRLKNNSLEILDAQRREKFIGIVKKYFAKLWL